MPQNHARSAFLIRPVSLTGIPIRWASQDNAATCRRVRGLRRRTDEYDGICCHRKAKTGNVDRWCKQPRLYRRGIRGLPFTSGKPLTYAPTHRGSSYPAKLTRTVGARTCPLKYGRLTSSKRFHWDRGRPVIPGGLSLQTYLA